MFSLTFSLLVTILHSTTADDILAHPPCGPIRGSTMTTNTGQTILSFRGIPFAEAPTGKLRFQRPEPKASWTSEPLDATEEGPECIQYEIIRKTFIGQEDCLHLNVYTHQLSETTRPVIVFIHGGAFVSGSGSSEIYGPKKILEHDVVLVTINYRLHALGFLSTMDSAAPGNYGLLDQVEALKWIQKNIKAFGGDPNKVTISGESAGGASVLYQVLSPLSKGLFQRAISMSGTPLDPWAFHQSTYWTDQLVNRVGCKQATNEEIIDCLRKLPASKITKQMRDFSSQVLAAFGPVVDHHFLPDYPQNLLSKGKIANRVPLMMGITKDEGLTFFAFLKRSMFAAFPPTYSNDFLQAIIASSLNKQFGKIPSQAMHLISEDYYDDVNTADQNALKEATVKLMTDAMSVAPHYQTAKDIVNAGHRPFIYRMDYQTNHSILKMLGDTESRGVSHGDDLFFLFETKHMFPYEQLVNDATENKFLKLWINFAHFGNPTPYKTDDNIRWDPASPRNFVEYRLDDPMKAVLYEPDKDLRLDFWMRKIPATIAETETKDEL